MSDEHLMVRPAWRCTCGAAQWPCARARSQLLKTRDPLSLGMYASDWLREAATDLPESTPAELFDRFMRWTRPMTVRAAEPGEVDAISQTLAEAYRHTPIAAWLVTDPDQRYRICYDLFSIVVEQALKSGKVRVTDKLDAVALWQPRLGPVPDRPGFSARLRAATRRRADRFTLLEKVLQAHHPGHAHHHLAYLGVHPARQSRGLGSALLSHQHRLLDTARVASYLVAGDERSRDLYLRHGYHAEGYVRLPEDGPLLWPMWRRVPPPVSLSHD